MITERTVLEALSTVEDPDLHRDLVSLGMIRDLRIRGADVSFEVVLTTPACPLKGRIEEDCRRAVSTIPGVGRVDIRMGARVSAVRSPEAPGGIPGVKNIVAVASGKGGVGKSTVSVNLAVALAETGARVGLLDADVYGPSIPLMMGIQRMPEMDAEQRILPLESHGVRLMSLGFLLPDASAPVIWRGPMVAKTVNQFLRQVDWGELDYLLIDLPPGTGDAQLTLSQSVALSGVLIVTTPQDMAMQIANRVLVMFRNVKVPILGILENMSTFVCPHCGETTEIFGRGGGQRFAQRNELEYFGGVPIDVKVRQGGDAGVPAVAQREPGPAAQVLRSLARTVAARMSVRAAQQAPAITIS